MKNIRALLFKIRIQLLLLRSFLPLFYRTMSARIRKLIPIVLLTVVFSCIPSPTHSEPITGAVARPNPRPRPNPRKFIQNTEIYLKYTNI